MVYCMGKTFEIIIAQMEVDQFKQLCAHMCLSEWADTIQQPLQQHSRPCEYHSFKSNHYKINN